MKLTSDIYVPAVRWRMGEYQALSRLSDKTKQKVVPIVTIPEIEFDFEEWKPKKTVQQHVEPFPTRFQKKWGARPAWIGVHPSISDKPMDDGTLIIMHVFSQLRHFNESSVPVIPVSGSPAVISAVRDIVRLDQRGVGLSVRMEDLMKPGTQGRVDELAQYFQISLSDVDLIVDLGAPNFEPYNAFSGALSIALANLGNLNAFRNVVLLGTSIPETFKDLGKGKGQIVRHDWQFYCSFIKALPYGTRRPNYGDYTIVHPEFTPRDMRKLKSAGKVVYATTKSWFVIKGGAFRDNPAQMHGHCQIIIDEGIFKGASFSQGDEYIADCALKKVKPSNQPWWKYVTINHHITLVVDDLANLVV